MGELFLNKNIPNFIRIAKSQGHFAVLTTNGTFLSEENATQVLEAGIDLLKISFDGAKKVTIENQIT
jgi:MoaA/NifB/PqqE/SkfB family radical SAM enzyme